MPQYKLKTSMERIFLHKPNGLYQEFLLFFTHNMDSNTDIIVSSKLDKIVCGKYYKKCRYGEKAIFGDEIDFKFKGDDGPSTMIPVVDINVFSSYKKLAY